METKLISVLYTFFPYTNMSAWFAVESLAGGDFDFRGKFYIIVVFSVNKHKGWIIGSRREITAQGEFPHSFTLQLILSSTSNLSEMICKTLDKRFILFLHFKIFLAAEDRAPAMHF